MTDSPDAFFLKLARFENAKVNLTEDPVEKIVAHVALELTVKTLVLAATKDPRADAFRADVGHVLAILEKWVEAPGKGGVAR